jgi:hypothetical protein
LNVADAVVAWTAAITRDGPADLDHPQGVEVRRTIQGWIDPTESVLYHDFGPRIEPQLIRERAQRLWLAISRLVHCAPRSGRWQNSDGSWYSANVGFFYKNDAVCFTGGGMDECRADALAELEAAKNSFKILMTARPDQPNGSGKPRWTRFAKTLWDGDDPVYKFEKVAPALFKILDAFEASGWEDTIKPPEDVGSVQDAKDSLNERLASGRIRFGYSEKENCLSWYREAV